MTDPKVPRVVGLLAAVALAIAAQRYAPGLLPAVLVLVVLYAVVTHGDRFLRLVGVVPAGLRRAYVRAS